MLGKPRIRLNNLKTSLRFPCLGLNPIIDSINVLVTDPMMDHIAACNCFGSDIFCFIRTTHQFTTADFAMSSLTHPFFSLNSQRLPPLFQAENKKLRGRRFEEYNELTAAACAVEVWLGDQSLTGKLDCTTVWNE